MRELIKSILILANAVFSEEKKKNRYLFVAGFKKEDLSICVGFDYLDRLYNDERDTYRNDIIVNPDNWDSNESINLRYDFKKDRFLSQIIYADTGEASEFKDEDMLNRIYDALKCIAKELKI